jgi:hypothetical protein
MGILAMGANIDNVTAEVGEFWRAFNHPIVGSLLVAARSQATTHRDAEGTI